MYIPEKNSNNIDTCSSFIVSLNQDFITKIQHLNHRNINQDYNEQRSCNNPKEIEAGEKKKLKELITPCL